MEPKNVFLKIMSIILLIGGIFYLIISAAAIALAAGGPALMEAVGAGSSNELADLRPFLIVGGILMLIAGLVAVIAGSLGLKACKDPSKSKKCIVLGIIIIIPSLVSLIMNIASASGFNSVNAVVVVAIGIAIPILYILAAVKNKQAA